MKAIPVYALEKLRAYWKLYCHVCGSELYPLYLDMNPFWCKKCKKLFTLELREIRQYSKEHIYEALGFPKEKT